MSLPRRRRIAWTVAVCYLWASALSGMWHNHSHEHAVGCAAEHPAEHSHRHADCDGASHEHGDRQGSPDSDDDCVVCRFVAQSAVQAPPAPLPLCGELTVDVRPHLPAAPPPVFFSSALARAPPAIG